MRPIHFVVSMVVPWVFLAVAGSTSAFAATELQLPGCASVAEGERVCIPVTLASGGNRVASTGFTLRYDTTALRLPGGSADVQPGSALTGGQQLAASVSEDSNTGSGEVRVTITPPIRVPIPAMSDGPVCAVCFTAPADAAGGCADLDFAAVEAGDDRGQSLAVGGTTAGD